MKGQGMTRVRLELIALGMILAKPGDRELILSKLTPGMFTVDYISDIVRDMKAGNFETMLSRFRSWDIVIDTSVAEAVSDKLERWDREIQAMEAAARLADLSGCTNVTEITRRLEAALLEAKKFSEGN